MAKTQHFAIGDVVTHPRRPEWGRGVVKQARPMTHQGQPAQRLAIDFANHGRVVINTAVAPLAPKGTATPMTRNSTSTLTADHDIRSGEPQGRSDAGAGGWLAALERAGGHNSHELWDLPTPMTDPFASLTERLKATLDGFGYSAEPRSLLDWAVTQTGLDDPMSKYTRHELEEAFPRYARNRDQNLHQLIRQIKRKGESATLSALQSRLRSGPARSALQKAMRY